MSTSDRVAVIGVGALLPDALDIEALWSNLLNRRSALRPIPTEIWDPQHFYGHDTEEEDLSSSQLGGVVRGMRFDPREFNIPPSTEAALDITQKAGLLAARSALGQIGISGPTDGIPAAVIIGNATAGMQSRTEQVLGQSHRLLEATLEELPEFRTLRHGARQALKQQLRQSWRSQFPRINS